MPKKKQQPLAFFLPSSFFIRLEFIDICVLGEKEAISTAFKQPLERRGSDYAPKNIFSLPRLFLLLQRTLSRSKLKLTRRFLRISRGRWSRYWNERRRKKKVRAEIDMPFDTIGKRENCRLYCTLRTSRLIRLHVVVGYRPAHLRSQPSGTRRREKTREWCSFSWPRATSLSTSTQKKMFLFFSRLFQVPNGRGIEQK